MADVKYDNIAQMLKIIAHPCRLRIIEMLRAGGDAGYTGPRTGALQAVGYIAAPDQDEK